MLCKVFVDTKSGFGYLVNGAAMLKAKSWQQQQQQKYSFVFLYIVYRLNCFHLLHSLLKPSQLTKENKVTWSCFYFNAIQRKQLKYYNYFNSSMYLIQKSSLKWISVMQRTKGILIGFNS
jgi:hypothetical protein